MFIIFTHSLLFYHFHWLINVDSSWQNAFREIKKRKRIKRNAFAYHLPTRWLIFQYFLKLINVAIQVEKTHSKWLKKKKKKGLIEKPLLIIFLRWLRSQHSHKLINPDSIRWTVKTRLRELRIRKKEKKRTKRKIERVKKNAQNKIRQNISRSFWRDLIERFFNRKERKKGEGEGKRKKKKKRRRKREEKKIKKRKRNKRTNDFVLTEHSREGAGIIDLCDTPESGECRWQRSTR